MTDKEKVEMLVTHLLAMAEYLSVASNDDAYDNEIDAALMAVNICTS